MNIPTPQYKEIIKIVESAILSTDLALYFKYAVEIISFLSTKVMIFFVLEYFKVMQLKLNGALISCLQIVFFKH